MFTSLDMVQVLYLTSDCSDSSYLTKTRYVFELIGESKVDVQDNIPMVTVYGRPLKAYVTVDTVNLGSNVICNNPITSHVEFDVSTNVCMDKTTEKDLFASVKSFLGEAEIRTFVFSWTTNGTLIEDNAMTILRSGEWGCSDFTADAPKDGGFDFAAWVTSPIGIVVIVVIVVVIVMIFFFVCKKRPKPKKMPIVAKKASF